MIDDLAQIRLGVAEAGDVVAPDVDFPALALLRGFVGDEATANAIPLEGDSGDAPVAGRLLELRITERFRAGQ